MSKADEAFLDWKTVRKSIYDPRQYFAASDAWAAACEWQRQQCIQAVEGEKLEHYTASCPDSGCPDCAYQDAIEDAIGAVKGE